MADKLVQLAKTLPFVVKTPSEADKMRCEGKRGSSLWTHEARMFNERTVYLNKSTTKYIIIGVHAKTFEPTIKICDRATGAYVTVSSLERIGKFRELVQKLVNGEQSFNAEARGAEVQVEVLSTVLWRITSGPIGLTMHKVSLDNFLLFSDCIFTELNMRMDGAKYHSFISELCDEIVKNHMTVNDVWKHLHGVINDNMAADGDKFRFSIAKDLVLNRGYFMIMDEYSHLYNVEKNE